MTHTALITFRSMQAKDLPFAAACTAGEGWVSEDYVALEGFFRRDSQGCLLAEEDGVPVGICIATWYGKSGFIGELIVRPQARGKGVGTALLNRGVSLLRARGADTIYLDGVLKAVGLYECNGFRKVCRSWRFSGYSLGRKNARVRPMDIGDLDQVSALDQVSFGENRRFFLQRRLECFPKLSYVLLDGQTITGYILGREGANWISAGPWVVSESAYNPVDLFDTFALQARGRSISLGVLDTNQQACELMSSLGFEPRQDSPWRMSLGVSHDFGTSPRCYAIGSAAKG